MKDKVKKIKGATIEDLAGMVKRGFDHVDERFEQVDKKLEQHDKRFDVLEKRFDVVEQGQEEIKLKLGNVAYRFELVELERRVDILERKISKQ